MLELVRQLADNGIDLTRMPIEVAPIAHYHMGGVKADAAMATELAGLYAAGEVVGGANGATDSAKAEAFARAFAKSLPAEVPMIQTEKTNRQDAKDAETEEDKN